MDWDINAALAAIGLKLGTTVVGAVTSFASLRFFDGLHLWEKWTTFVGGWAIAAWGAAPLTDYFALSARVEAGIALVLGLFGMSLTAAIVNLIKQTDWGSILKGVIDIILRRPPAPPNGGAK